MNERQKEVEKAKLAAEKKELLHLKAIYNKAAQDIAKKLEISNGKINVLLKDWDNLDEVQKSILKSQIYQRNFQLSLKKQIDGFLKDINAEQYESIDQYMKECYKTGFLGSMYDLHGQGIPIVTPIDQKQIAEAIKINSKISKKLYKKLGEDVDFLKKRIANNIARGIATASEYKVIARNIAADSNMGFNRTMRIARTEGHGMQCQAAEAAQHAAKKAGADVLKQWDAALDKRTRASHAKLDGEIRELDEKFSNGMMRPADKNGVAAEVVNCRCALLQRARWALDDDELQTLKDRAAYYGLDKTDNFNDFKKKYLKAVEGSEKSSKIKEKEVLDVEGNTKKLKSALGDSEYREYLELLENNENIGVKKLYAKYADGIDGIKLKSRGGTYYRETNILEFSFETNKYIEKGKHKYSVLAHEYGHYFDSKAKFKTLHFKEIDAINSIDSGKILVKRLASTCDEFLEAVRADKRRLSNHFTKEANYGADLKKALLKEHASCGVQDAIDGMFGYRICWGHGSGYYNRKYSDIKSLNKHKELQKTYKDLGFDASNQAKVKEIVRNYETASEMFANILDAIVCGGKELEYVKEYLPESYKAILKLLEGVE